MNALRLTLVIIVVTALQATLLPAWRPFGVVPDLLVGVVVILALVTTASQALICAMVAGLVLDLTSAVTFGQNLGFYTIVALGVSLLVRFGLAFDSLGWRYGLAVLGVLLGHAIILGELMLAQIALPPGVVVTRIVLGIVFELGIVTLVSPLLTRLTRDGNEMSLGAVR